jgi:hypothetical protein
MGRNLACGVSTVADHLAMRAMPYVGAVEMALGRTQAGYEHLQANAVRVRVEQARVQAEQARMQAEIVREQLKDLGMLDQDQLLALNRRVTMPRVVVSMPKVKVSGPEHVFVCPRTRVHVATPEVPAPEVRVEQDSI